MVNTFVINEASSLKRKGTNNRYQPHSPRAAKFQSYIEDISDDVVPSPTPNSRNTKHVRAKFDQGRSQLSHPCPETPADSDRERNEEDDTTMYEGFDIQGVSREEIAFWSELAPAGQKLTDIETSPRKMRPKTEKAPCACC